jgi:uncharacterized membrane protein YdjX (TVP38/TMEM64 family)
VKPFLLYTLARLLMFAAAWGLVWLVAQIWLEWNSVTALWTALIALAISAAASFVLLRNVREQLAARVAAGSHRVQRRYDAAKRKEDVEE